ncbi:MAG: tetratricopeptide repeat protein [Planctomycetota bacterium]|nr:tetratricopeptide repeat protein [Planctomycetota bacterium]
MKYARILSAIAAFFFLLAVSTSAYAAEQEIRRWKKDGSYVTEKPRGQIIGETYKSLKYRGLGDQPRGDVIFVFYSDDPNFSEAEEFYAELQWAAAIRAYKEALERSKRDWVPAYAHYRIGQCYWYQGDTKNAVKWLEKLNKEMPENPFLGPALCYIGEIYIAMGQPNKAEKAIEKVRLNRELQDCWVERAQMLYGKLLIAKRDFRRAKAHLKSISSRLKYQSIRQQANFGLGECIEAEARAEKDPKLFEDAIKIYEDIAEAYNEETLGRAWAYIARCYYNIKEYENAYHYGLRAGLKYVDIDPALAAQGLYYAGKAFLALYHSTDDDDPKRMFYGSNIKIIRRILKSKLLGTRFGQLGLSELK